MSPDDAPHDDAEDMTPQDAAEGEDALQETALLKAELAALREQMLRTAADAENTKRRAERDANDARAFAIQKFARDLLGVADNLQRAMAALPDGSADPAVKNFVLGIEMTEKELLGAFERNGLKRINPARGDKFDPHQHQAVMEQPGTDVAPGGVVQVLAPGYELLGRLVRPAMVATAAKGASPEAPAANPYSGAADDDAGGSVDRRA